MLLEDLVLSEKIDRDAAKIYQLFTASQIGIDVLRYLEESIFMEEPRDTKAIAYGESEGRKSVVRDLKKTISGINKLLQEQENV